MARQKGQKSIDRQGRSKTKIYRIWRGMHQRCLNPKSSNYEGYGARGIDICERWMDFDLFHADMGDAPEGPYSMDRIDNNKGYSPDNCRWAYVGVQAQNKRPPIGQQFLEYGGLKLPYGKWAEITGIPILIIKRRLKHQWTAKDALQIRLSAKELEFLGR